MSKNPVLGYVKCRTPGCGGTMRVRQSARGRGGHVRKYGHCSTCGAMDQKNSDQDYLSGYSEETPTDTPVTPAEPAPVVASEPAAVEDFDPVKHAPETVSKPGIKTRSKRSGGGGSRVVLGFLAVAAVAVGAGFLVKQ